MIAINRPELACPCCSKHLCQVPNPAKVILYCPWGDCPCTSMNDGAEGQTDAEAYANLEDKFNSYLEKQEDSCYPLESDFGFN